MDTGAFRAWQMRLSICHTLLLANQPPTKLQSPAAVHCCPLHVATVNHQLSAPDKLYTQSHTQSTFPSSRQEENSCHTELLLMLSSSEHSGTCTTCMRNNTLSCRACALRLTHIHTWSSSSHTHTHTYTHGLQAHTHTQTPAQRRLSRIVKLLAFYPRLPKPRLALNINLYGRPYRSPLQINIAPRGDHVSPCYMTTLLAVQRPT